MYNNIYIYVIYKLVLANCIACVCYVMIVDYNDIYKYIYLDIYIFIIILYLIHYLCIYIYIYKYICIYIYIYYVYICISICLSIYDSLCVLFHDGRLYSYSLPSWNNTQKLCNLPRQIFSILASTEIYETLLNF